MIDMLRLSFISLFMLGSFSFAQGVIDGFFKGKGNTDLALSYSLQKSDIYFAGFNEINYKRNLNAIGVFAAHGVTNKFDVIINIPFINTTFQDASIFGKYELFSHTIKETKISCISALGTSFPLAKYEVNSGQAIGQRAVQILPKLVVQFKFGNGIFIQTQGGYNYALSPVASSIPFSVKAGMAKVKIYTDVWFDYQHGIGDKDYLGNVPFNSFRELVVSYQRIGGVFYYTLKPKLGIFLNYAYTFSGRNTSQGYFIGTGAVLKFKRKTEN